MNKPPGPARLIDISWTVLLLILALGLLGSSHRLEQREKAERHRHQTELDRAAVALREVEARLESPAAATSEAVLREAKAALEGLSGRLAGLRVKEERFVSTGDFLLVGALVCVFGIVWLQRRTAFGRSASPASPASPGGGPGAGAPPLPSDENPCSRPTFR